MVTHSHPPAHGYCHCNGHGHGHCCGHGDVYGHGHLLYSNTRQYIQTVRDDSFQVHGPRLFNCLPIQIRNLTNCSVDSFKFKLDNFLSLVPDEPKVSNLFPSGLCPLTARPSNSIIHQVTNVQMYTAIQTQGKIAPEVGNGVQP